MFMVLMVLMDDRFQSHSSSGAAAFRNVGHVSVTQCVWFHNGLFSENHVQTDVVNHLFLNSTLNNKIQADDTDLREQTKKKAGAKLNYGVDLI